MDLLTEGDEETEDCEASLLADAELLINLNIPHATKESNNRTRNLMKKNIKERTPAILWEQDLHCRGIFLKCLSEMVVVIFGKSLMNRNLQ